MDNVQQNGANKKKGPEKSTDEKLAQLLQIQVGEVSVHGIIDLLQVDYSDV